MASISVSVNIVCPACGEEMPADVDAIDGSGYFPQNHVTCGDCGEKLIVEADVTVYTRRANSHPTQEADK